MDDGVGWGRAVSEWRVVVTDMTPIVQMFRDIRAAAASDAEAVAVMTAIIGGMANIAPPKGADSAGGE